MTNTVSVVSCSAIEIDSCAIISLTVDRNGYVYKYLSTDAGGDGLGRAKGSVVITDNNSLGNKDKTELQKGGGGGGARDLEFYEAAQEAER